MQEGIQREVVGTRRLPKRDVFRLKSVGMMPILGSYLSIVYIWVKCSLFSTHVTSSLPRDVIRPVARNA